MANPYYDPERDILSSQASASSQESAENDLMISSQDVMSSQHGPQIPSNSHQSKAFLPRKRKNPEGPARIITMATNKRISLKPRPTPRAPPPTRSSGRLLYLQARDTDKVYKMNEDALAKTSDLFKYKLFVETPTPAQSAPAYPKDTGRKEKLRNATALDPKHPLVVLDVHPKPLFLYCLWILAPDRLSLYLDSTIPRPSLAFTTYLFSAFLLATALKDAPFLANLVQLILRDPAASKPDADAVTWAYENTPSAGEALLRKFVVDCTLTWADEHVDEWRRLAEEVPKAFLVDVSCRLMELGGKGLVKSDVGSRFTFGMGWPVEDLERTAEEAGKELEYGGLGLSARFLEG